MREDGIHHSLVHRRESRRSDKEGVAYVSFDELTYLDLNPDVLQAVLNGKIQSGSDHWKHFGKVEHRGIHSPENLPSDWNEERYLRLNPDISAVVRAGAFSSGYEHWVRYGRFEGRLGGQPWSTTSLQNALAVASRGVNMFGFRGTGIGLGSATRGYASAIRPLLPLHETTVPWNQNSVIETTIDSPPHAINIIHMNPDVLPIFLGRHGGQVLHSHFNVAIWVWELHAGYAHWCGQSSLFNEIWTPSAYSADAIRPVSKTPVYVIPHVVDALPVGEAGKSQGVFQFLYIFDLASTFERKNPLALVRAFRKAFGNRTDVQLTLKYHHSEFDSPAVALLERVTKSIPNIRTINQTLPEEQVYALLRSCDCFVSPHRSEGFGLNIAAAMYYGKPVIATGYSGNMDFTTPENSFLIDYDLIAVQQETGAYKAGYVWAEPSEDHLAELLRAVVAAPDQARERGERGRVAIQERFSLNAVSAIIRRRFTEWGL